MLPVHYCFSLLKLPRVATTKYQKLGDLEQQNVLLHISKTISLWSRWQSWFFWGVSFSYLFILNWRIIALQYCVGLCHTSTWISHRHTCVSCLLNPSPSWTPLPYPFLPHPFWWWQCPGFGFPVSYIKLPLAICFTYGSVYVRRRQWHPTPVLLPGKSHGRRSLVGCSPWGR